MNDAARTIQHAPPAVELAGDAANGNRLAAVARQAIPAGTLLGQYQGRVLQDLRELTDVGNEYIVAVWPRLQDEDAASGTGVIDESRRPWEPLYYIDAFSTSHAVAPPPVVIQNVSAGGRRADAWIQSSEQLTNWTRYIRRRRTNTPVAAPPANVALVTSPDGTGVRPGRLYAVTSRAIAAGEALTFDNKARPVCRRIDVTPGRLRVLVHGEVGDQATVALYVGQVLGLQHLVLPAPYAAYVSSYGFAVNLAYDEDTGSVVGFSVALLGGRVLMAVHVAAPIRNSSEVRGVLLADAMDTMRGSDAAPGAHGTFIEVPDRQQLAVFGRLDPAAWLFRQVRRPPSWRQAVQPLFWDLVLPSDDDDVAEHGTRPNGRWRWAMETLHQAGLSARNRHKLVIETDRLAVYVAVDWQQRRVAVVVAGIDEPVIEFMHVRGVFHASRAPLVYRDLLQTYGNLVRRNYASKQDGPLVLRVRARRQTMLAMVLELAGYKHTGRGEGPFSLDTFERST